jgi:IS1 family transposase
MNRMDTKRRAAIIAALVEGVGIRATCRMTGASKGAVTKLIAELGPVCAAYMDEHFRELPCDRLEVDEIWAFCGSKEKNVPAEKKGVFGNGDVWCFTAIDAETKLIPSFLVGYRDAGCAAECIGCERHAVAGNPDPNFISTSYVERANLSIRMGLRRYTRLTNAHSKKIENHCAALAIYFFHYNFVRVHQSLRCTPAMAASVTPHLWSVAEMVDLLPAEAPKKRGPYKTRVISK